MGGAYLMSQKLKICKCISYACLTVIWLANSGSLELWNNISNKFYLSMYLIFLSTNVQSYQKNICEIQQTLWHVTCLASHFERGLISHLNLRWDKLQKFQLYIMPQTLGTINTMSIRYLWLLRLIGPLGIPATFAAPCTKAMNTRLRSSQLTRDVLFYLDLFVIDSPGGLCLPLLAPSSLVLLTS